MLLKFNLSTLRMFTKNEPRKSKYLYKKKNIVYSMVDYFSATISRKKTT